MQPDAAATPINEIRLNDHNPRTISRDAFERLCESIKRDPEFMLLRPIVVDDDGVILGGNMRYRACLEIGMTELPADWVVKATGLTKEQRRRFIIVDNAPEGMAGEWDWDILANEWDIDDLGNVGLEPLNAWDQIDDVEPPALKDGDQDTIRSMTFTLSDMQVEMVTNAIAQAKAAGPFPDQANENGNGNALARIAEHYLGKS